MSEFVEELKDDEGFRSEVYLDHLGNPTIGFGTMISELVVTREQAESWLLGEVAEKEARLVLVPFYNRMSEVRKDVIRSMAYQMGVAGVRRFKNMWLAISESDYEMAGAEMRDSQWFRDPATRGRANRMAVRMETGVW